jgi:hypothetical protein
MYYRYLPPASVPIDGGNLVADNRYPSVYQHLKELYILNAHISLTIFGYGNIHFFSPIFVENTYCNGFSRTESHNHRDLGEIMRGFSV